jgi:hypothetical protein
MRTVITLTDTATVKVKELLEAEGATDLALRVAVRPGGCSGYSYELFFDGAVAADDEHENRPHRSSDRALWFQFETTLPLSLSAWARTAPNRVPHFGRLFRAYRTHFPT